MTEPGSPISLYRQERRAQEIPGLRREDLGTVVRYTPTSPLAEGLVCFTRVAETDLHAEIERHIAHFRAANVGFEWKVYDSDEPASLRDRLRSAGFEEGEPESLMVYETRTYARCARARGRVGGRGGRTDEPAHTRIEGFSRNRSNLPDEVAP